jgi:hypothetical protein
LLENSYTYKLNVADIVKGVVVKREKDGFLVDIGAKTEAFLPNSEVVNSKDQNPDDFIKLWDEKEFYITKDEEENEVIEEEASGQVLERGDYEWLLYLHCQTSQIPESSLLTEEEKEKFSPMLEVLNADYAARWNFNTEEQALLDAMLQENDGSADFDDIEVIVEMWMERNNK